MPDFSGESNIENPHLMYLNNNGKGQLEVRSTKYTISEALDTLNDGMNFLYCRPGGLYGETVLSIDTFTVSLTSGEIDQTDLVDLMDDIAEFAGDVFHADGRASKAPLMFEILAISASISDVDFEVRFFYEAGAPVSVTDSPPYTESWLYGGSFSNSCNTQTGIDAVDLFRRDLRTALIEHDEENGYYFVDPYYVCYYTMWCGGQEVPPEFFLVQMDEIYDLTDLLNVDDITIEDNDLDYYLFTNYSGFPNYDECLVPKEMNFHYEQMYDFISDLLPSPQGNYVIGGIEVGYDLLFAGLESVIGHNMIVLRTIKKTVDEEHEEAIDLPD